jgi:hypothetical protein
MSADLYPLAGAARDPRGVGQPPPTRRHRVPGGGEPCPQGAGEGAPPPVDRRPAPTPHCEGSPARATGLEAGRDDRDAGHDLAMAPAVDRPEVDVHVEAARPSRDHAGDLVTHSADGQGESRVGIHASRGRRRTWATGWPGVRSPRCSRPTGSRLPRPARPLGGRSSGPTGAKSRGPTSSPARSGPLEG